MINYSRKGIEDRLRADQALWHHLCPVAGNLLWPLAILSLGWDSGWWIGAAVVVLLSGASILLPGRLKLSLYLLDLLDAAFRLPTYLTWLLLVWHLSLRDPRFSVLGQPLIGAVAVTLCIWASMWVLNLAVRFSLRGLTFKAAS